MQQVYFVEKDKEQEKKKKKEKKPNRSKLEKINNYLSNFV